MGVPGLMSYILANRDRCVEYVDLVERARQSPDGFLELLVDFHSFEHLLLRKFTASLSAENPYLCVQGGEYGLLDAWVKRLVTDLEAVGVRLVWHADASRGCCQRTDEQRGRLWRRRLREELHRQEALLRWCSGYAAGDAGSGVEPIRPVCLEQQLMASLRSAGCQIRQAVRGEADYALAQELLTNRRALAVLSGDSDLCVFRDSVLIPLDLFDIHGDLGLDGAAASTGGGNQPPMPEQPLRLVVGLVSGPSLMRLLDFPSWELLLDLSIIMGNDFTGPLLDSLAAELGVRPLIKQEGGGGGVRLKLEDFAAWLRSTGGLAKSPAFEHHLAANPRLRAAVEHSRQFYCLMLIEGVDSGCVSATPSKKCLIDAQLEAGVLAGRYSTTLVAMRRGRYWRRVCLEDNTPGHPAAEEGAAVTLRDWAHRCLIADGENEIREEFDPRDGGRWIRRRAAPRRVRGVHLAPLLSGSGSGGGAAAAAAAFCDLLGMPEAVRTYGWRCGPLCATLRHFLDANCPPRLLCLDTDEAVALAATTLGLHLLRTSWYARLPVRPSVRCVTVASAWLAAFRAAFASLAPALGLPPGETPTPADAFSGSVFTAMFMLRAHGGSGMRHLDQESRGRAERDRARVVREKRHVMARIMAELYPGAGLGE